MENEDWQDGLGEDEVPEFFEDYEIMREIAESENDEMLKDRLDEIDAHCAMIAEGRFGEAVKAIRDARGESGVMDLVFAIERNVGWHMEIVTTKADIEDYAFSKHGVYDPKTWLMARNTDAWNEMILEVTYACLRRRRDIVDEAFRMPVDGTRKTLRRLAYEAGKRIDLRLM